MDIFRLSALWWILVRQMRTQSHGPRCTLCTLSAKYFSTVFSYVCSSVFNLLLTVLSICTLRFSVSSEFSSYRSKSLIWCSTGRTTLLTGSRYRKKATLTIYGSTKSFLQHRLKCCFTRICYLALSQWLRSAWASTWWMATLTIPVRAITSYAMEEVSGSRFHFMDDFS